MSELTVICNYCFRKLGETPHCPQCRRTLESNGAPNVETLTLPVGYDRRKNPETRTVRRMTADEAKCLTHGRVLVIAHNNVLRGAKINGSPKTWKKDASRVEVPLKYGMREHFRDSARNGVMEYLAVEILPDGTERMYTDL